MNNRSLAYVIAAKGFAQCFALLCSRLRSLEVCYEEEVSWMWGWETEGKGRVCVRGLLCR